jgi:hypothetical protein
VQVHQGLVLISEAVLTRNIIRDGYTRTFFIAPMEGIHEGLSGSYRPLLAEQVEAIQESSEKAKSAATGLHLVASAVTKQLVSWSEIDSSEKPVEIAFESVRRLPYKLLHRLYRVIAGLEPSDIEETATPEEASDYIKDLEAEVAGQLPGLARETAAEKN